METARTLGQNSDSFPIGTIPLSVVFSWTAGWFANTSISTSECLKLDFFLYASFIKDKSVKPSNLNYYFIFSICLQVSFEGNSLNTFTVISLLWVSSFVLSSKLTTLYFTSLNYYLSPPPLSSSRIPGLLEGGRNYLLSVYADSLSPVPFLKPSFKCFQNHSLQDNDEIAAKVIVGILVTLLTLVFKVKKENLFVS